MMNSTIANRSALVAWAFVAALARAQTNTFQEAVPPAGLVTGFISAGGRSGALIAGGNTVYVDDTFSVVTCGQKVTWKVLSIAGMSGRFAREVPAGEHLPQETEPNFGRLVELLERSAAVYRAASTTVLKEQRLSDARLAAASWCASNTEMRVRGDLFELEMLDDAQALLRLKNVECCPQGSGRTPGLYVQPLFEAVVPMTRVRALSCKAGDAVLLRGRPTIKEKPLISSAPVNRAAQSAFTRFSMLSDSGIIATLALENAACEIFDPRLETVKPR